MSKPLVKYTDVWAEVVDTMRFTISYQTGQPIPAKHMEKFVLPWRNMGFRSVAISTNEGFCGINFTTAGAVVLSTKYGMYRSHDMTNYSFTANNMIHIETRSTTGQQYSKLATEGLRSCIVVDINDFLTQPFDIQATTVVGTASLTDLISSFIITPIYAGDVNIS